MEEDEFTDEKSLGTSQSISISTKQIDKWTEEIKTKPDVKIIGTVVSAFREAIQTVLDNEQSADAQDTKEARKPSKKKTAHRKRHSRFSLHLRRTYGIMINTLVREEVAQHLILLLGYALLNYPLQ